MKRIHLFEIEDQSWFPNWLRVRLTRMINVMHRLLRSKDHLAELLHPIIEEQGISTIVDLCSGSGGPIPDAVSLLREEYGHNDLNLIMTDIYPNLDLAREVNANSSYQRYLTEPVNASEIDPEISGMRTMVSSFHHMDPKTARQILSTAKNQGKPILIYEMSDNSAPIFLSFLALPINLVMALFVNLAVRPMTWQQIIFSYLIPILPVTFAWDGAISNMRTYTLDDLDELLEGLHSDDYHWKKGTIKDRGKQLYLIGKPIKQLK